jgi:transposase
LIKTLDALGMPECHYVLDRGFYSQKNVDALMEKHMKFTLSVPLNNKWVQKACDEVRESIEGPEGYRLVDDEVLYVHSRLYPWGDTRKRCYLHLYYNAHARANAIDQFNTELLAYKNELESNQCVLSHLEAYDTFFIVKETPKRGRSVSYNQEAVRQYISRYAGFMALLSNKIKDPVKALQVYRDKDKVEKCFDDLKNQLDMKRLRMHTSATADGRLFVQFIALIYISAIRRAMRQSDLIQKYSPRELLDEMDTFTKIIYKGKRSPIFTELTKPQRHILKHLSIPTP